jgi:uncharacterized protein (TIGR00369 family)
MNKPDPLMPPAKPPPLDLAALMPFAERIGIKLESASKEEVRGEIEWRTDLCTAAGVMHGGVLMSFADSLGAICALLNLPAGGSTATIESKTNFFRAVRRGPVKGVSKPLHVGRTTVVVQTDLFDAEQRRVAQVTQTQAILVG